MKFILIIAIIVSATESYGFESKITKKRCDECASLKESDPKMKNSETVDTCHKCDFLTKNDNNFNEVMQSKEPIAMDPEQMREINHNINMRMMYDQQVDTMLFMQQMQTLNH